MSEKEILLMALDLIVYSKSMMKSEFLKPDAGDRLSAMNHEQRKQFFRLAKALGFK